jgi:hypothetical protein
VSDSPAASVLLPVLKAEALGVGGARVKRAPIRPLLTRHESGTPALQKHESPALAGFSDGGAYGIRTVLPENAEGKPDSGSRGQIAPGSERPTGAGPASSRTTLRLVRLPPRKYTVKLDRTAAQKQRTKVRIGFEGDPLGLFAYAGRRLSRARGCRSPQAPGSAGSRNQVWKRDI